VLDRDRRDLRPLAHWTTRRTIDAAREYAQFECANVLRAVFIDTAAIRLHAAVFQFDAGLERARPFHRDQFVIQNEDTDDWTDVKMEINGGFFSGGYELRTPRIEAGSTATVGAAQFAKSDGTRFNPFQMKPQKFVITAKIDGKNGTYVGGWQ
jgi:hypothetical protein